MRISMADIEFDMPSTAELQDGDIYWLANILDPENPLRGIWANSHTGYGNVHLMHADYDNAVLHGRALNQLNLNLMSGVVHGRMFDADIISIGNVEHEQSE